jgi:hypothetical protein
LTAGFRYPTETFDLFENRSAFIQLCSDLGQTPPPVILAGCADELPASKADQHYLNFRYVSGLSDLRPADRSRLIGVLLIRAGLWKTFAQPPFLPHQRAGVPTALMQDTGYLTAGLSPLMVRRFNPLHDGRHFQ